MYVNKLSIDIYQRVDKIGLNQSIHWYIFGFCVRPYFQDPVKNMLQALRNLRAIRHNSIIPIIRK